MSATAEANVVDVDEAVRIAFEQFAKFYGEEKATSVLLEGVRYDGEHDEWEIAIGFDTDREQIVVSHPLLKTPERQVRTRVREARAFTLDAKTGAFREMRSLPD